MANDLPGKQLRIFVSSTFQDMRTERSILVGKVFPMVAAYCHKRKMEFIGVDLRWGVSEEQSKRGETVSICMNEIDRSRPLFMGMVGERYGWVPDGSPVSVTEQEILYGALNAPEGTEAFFYLRDDALTEELCGPFEPDERLDNLKNRIRESGYPVLDGYRDLESFASRVYADLTAAVDRLAGQLKESDPVQEKRNDQFFLAKRHAEGYVERAGLLDRLQKCVEEGGLTLVTGPSGVGKTALLARYALDHYPFLYFVGSEADKGWDQLARQLIGELKQTFQLDYPEPRDKEELRRALYIVLNMAAGKGHITLAIDKLDALALDDGFGLSWLPEELPNGVSVVATLNEGEVAKRLRARKHGELAVEPLTSDEAARVAESYLAAFAKTLSIRQMNLIRSSENARNPLYLITLLNEIRHIGRHDRLTGQLADYLSCEDTLSLFEKVLCRMDTDYDEEGEELPRRFFSLMDASRQGLTEAEFISLLDEVPQARFAPLLLALEPFTAVSGGAIHIAVPEFAQAVRRHYRLEEEERKASRGFLSSWFLAHPDTPRRFYVLPWLLKETGEWKKLEQTLSDAECFTELWHRNRSELKEYWAVIERRGCLEAEKPEGFKTEAASDDRKPKADEAAEKGNKPKESSAAKGYSPFLKNPECARVDLLIDLSEFFFETGDARSAADLLSFLTGETSPADEKQKGIAFGLLGNLYQKQGKLAPAQSCYQRKYAAFQKLGDLYEQQRALGNLGLIALMCRDLKEAQSAFEGVLTLALSLNQKDAQQVALGNLGNIAFSRKDFEKAKTLFERQKAISYDSSNTAGMINACGALGVLCSRMGDKEAAEREFTMQEEQSRKIGAADGLANALGNLAVLAHAKGEEDRAEELLREKLEICRKTGQFLGEQNALGNLADLAAERGNPEEALSLAKNRADITRSHRAFRLYADALLSQSKIEKALGMETEARQHFLEAHGIAKQQGFTLE